MFQVFDMSAVPENERNAMRAALDKNGIRYTEMSDLPNNRRPAIWVYSEESAKKAMGIIAKAQTELVNKAKNKHTQILKTRWHYLSLLLKVVVVSCSTIYLYITWEICFERGVFPKHWNVRGSDAQLYLLILNFPLIAGWFWLLSGKK